MLKWTASAQKLLQETPQSSLTRALNTAGHTPGLLTHKRRKRRATIANKENIPTLTSTPMVARTRNSPLVMAPLADILNVTPEAKNNETPIRRRQSVNIYNETTTAPPSRVNRRHSSVGFVVPQMPGYAATLPKYEEEYSPSTILPSGQQLALRGLLPDAFMDNPRYFTSPEVELEQKEVKGGFGLNKKRKLEQEFMAIAQEEEEEQKLEVLKPNQVNHTVLMSNKMGDQTLDKLIDAILDSARKDEKKKKPRKSFNIRRRTLIKNQVEHEQDITLSPSYAAGDDPCSDVSFLNCETFNKKELRPRTLQPESPIPATPQPCTPLAAANLNHRDLLQLPTPKPDLMQHDSFSLATPIKRPSPLKLQQHAMPMPAADQTDSFSLATPPVQSKLKRRTFGKIKDTPAAKKYKQQEKEQKKEEQQPNFFEIGLALPSIYV